jgi:GDP-L-fucose synthase
VPRLAAVLHVGRWPARASSARPQPSCACLALAAERYDRPEPVNLGAGFEITLHELAEKIRRLVGFEGQIVWDPGQPDGQPRRCLDTSRARQFGFQATTGFDEGLRRTVEWWQQTRSG